MLHNIRICFYTQSFMNHQFIQDLQEQERSNLKVAIRKIFPQACQHAVRMTMERESQEEKSER